MVIEKIETDEFSSKLVAMEIGDTFKVKFTKPNLQNARRLAGEQNRNNRLLKRENTYRISSITKELGYLIVTRTK